jgi:hypothetical protein
LNHIIGVEEPASVERSRIVAGCSQRGKLVRPHDHNFFSGVSPVLVAILPWLSKCKGLAAKPQHWRGRPPDTLQLVAQPSLPDVSRGQRPKF